MKGYPNFDGIRPGQTVSGEGNRTSILQPEERYQYREENEHYPGPQVDLNALSRGRGLEGCHKREHQESSR